MIAPGVYEHYKGNQYEVIGLGKIEATMEDVVVYRALYGGEQIWVRPVGNFEEDVEVNGVRRPRFVRV